MINPDSDVQMTLVGNEGWHETKVDCHGHSANIKTYKAKIGNWDKKKWVRLKTKGPQTYQLASLKCPTSAETLQGQNNLGLTKMRISSVPRRHHLHASCNHQHESALLWPPCTIQFCSTLGSIAHLLTTQLFQDPGFSVPSFNEWATGGYCRYFIVLEYSFIWGIFKIGSHYHLLYLKMSSIQLLCQEIRIKSHRTAHRSERRYVSKPSRSFSLWHNRDPFFTGLHGVKVFFPLCITTAACKNNQPGVWSLF